MFSRIFNIDRVKVKKLKDVCVLFFGVLPPPYTGQSIAFNETYLGVKCGRKILISHKHAGTSSFYKVLSSVYVTFKAILNLFLFRPNIVYITVSISLLASIKEVIIIFFARAVGAKVITHFHGAGIDVFLKSISSFYRAVIIRAYNKVDAHICLMPGMVHELRCCIDPNVRVDVVPNFYSKEMEHHCSNEVFNEFNCRILYLSNLIKSKGILETVEAFIQFKKQYASSELLIAGAFLSDEEMDAKTIKERFYELIDRSSGGITYYGPIKGEEKRNLLLSSDIFVLPTYYKIEAFPLSIIEAMRTGNFIITTNHNYLTDVVNESEGLIINKRSTSEIFNAFMNCVNNTELVKAKKKRNAEYARSKFSSSIYQQRIEAIFNDIIKDK